MWENIGIDMTIILKSIITCPNCGHQKEEQMPTDVCQFFYKCEICNTILKPKDGDLSFLNSFN